MLCEHYGRHHRGECWRKTGACLVCGLIEHHVSDYSRRAVVVQDQPTIAVVAATPIPARGRGHGRGDGDRGVGQCGAIGVVIEV
ncbi:pre-mrna-splicing factor slu7 [Gossypium australe]|uniref:Pre-mrna-splicing factor slu7 n=1 Tax=Gossypium australe TaxID=47621 RepID=A0A5B6VMU0_9ROSI|nr:pre-mrna-splicing factor slu7 [Gossypium australe]